MHNKLILKLFILSLLTFTSIRAQYFTSRINLQSSGSPYQVVSADFNGDNIPDIAALNFNDSSFTIWLNITDPADSIPRYTQKYKYTITDNPIQLAAADFDLDGLTDLVVAQSTGEGVRVLFNQTTPLDTNLNFSERIYIASTDIVSAVVAKDVNLDGYPDIVFTDIVNNKIFVFTMKNPWFTFSGKMTTGNGPQDIVIADLNNDNLPDILTANKKDKTISIFYHKKITSSSSADFNNRVDIGNGTEFRDISVGDINLDGYPDIIAASVADSSISFFIYDPTTKKFNATKQKMKNGISAVSLSDINGDGIKDFIFSLVEKGEVEIWFNDTKINTIPPAKAINFHTGKTPSSITTADVNRDGREDIIVSNVSDNTVTVAFNNYYLMNNGITFSMKSFPAKGILTDIAKADFNMDGKEDVAVSVWDSNSVSVFLNKTTAGNLTPDFSTRKDLKILSAGSNIETCDINMDGKPDIAVTNWGDNVSIFLNKTNAGDSALSFSRMFVFSTGVNAGPNSLAFGDLNADGKPDLVVTNQFPDVNNNYSIAVMINETSTGDSIPKFTNYQALDAAKGPWKVKIDDFNMDKKPDIAVANFTGGTVSFFINSTTAGDTTFSYSGRYDYNAGSGTAGLDAGDLNGDGAPDIAVANQNADSIAVLINKTLTGNAFNFSSPTMFPAEAGPVFIKITNIDFEKKPELLVANSSVKNVFSVFANGWIPGLQDVYFGDMVNYKVASMPAALTVADFNLDGKPDVITANQGSPAITVALNTSPLTDVKNNVSIGAPEKFKLLQNYPNPFNPTTNLIFELPFDSKVSLEVFNILGEKVMSVFNKSFKKGKHSIRLKMGRFSSGIYFARLKAGSYIQSIKMMLLK